MSSPVTPLGVEKIAVSLPDPKNSGNNQQAVSLSPSLQKVNDAALNSLTPPSLSQKTGQVLMEQLVKSFPSATTAPTPENPVPGSRLIKETDESFSLENLKTKLEIEKLKIELQNLQAQIFTKKDDSYNSIIQKLASERKELQAQIEVLKEKTQKNNFEIKNLNENVTTIIEEKEKQPLYNPIRTVIDVKNEIGNLPHDLVKTICNNSKILLGINNISNGCDALFKERKINKTEDQHVIDELNGGHTRNISIEKEPINIKERLSNATPQFIIAAAKGASWIIGASNVISYRDTIYSFGKNIVPATWNFTWQNRFPVAAALTGLKTVEHGYEAMENDVPLKERVTHGAKAAAYGTATSMITGVLTPATIAKGVSEVSRRAAQALTLLSEVAKPSKFIEKISEQAPTIAALATAEVYLAYSAYKDIDVLYTNDKLSSGDKVAQGALLLGKVATMIGMPAFWWITSNYYDATSEPVDATAKNAALPLEKLAV